jgi:hypothetical protein
MKKDNTKKNVENKIDLRKLDDVMCTSVVCGRQIKRMIKKFPSMKDFTIDCYVHNGHYTKFKLADNKFIWSGDKCKQITNESDFIDSDELNKLVVSTYRAMCDSQNDVDLVDTPEDLLAFAEAKLQEMLHDDTDKNNTIYNDFKVLADSTMVNPERTSSGSESQV